MRETPISHKQMLAMGWRRTDPRPWGKLDAHWEHRDGWHLIHCGHPTAHWPWALYDPKGRMHCMGRALYGENGKPTHGTAFDSLRMAATYVDKDGPGAIAAMDREVQDAPATVRWGMEPPEVPMRSRRQIPAAARRRAAKKEIASRLLTFPGRAYISFNHGRRR